MQMNEKDAAGLLTWYDENRRILPWREDPAPYHVWLSEIMLQQTRVEAVKEYYRRFTEALPDIRSLAEAGEDTYLKLWQGLGYYSRVRNLHKAAQVIMGEYKGRMPETAKELIRLPGIGPYTAAAIASIAFGEPVPAVDGNLLRIFARLTCYPENCKLPAAGAAAGSFYGSFIPKERPGDFNQALMDLGAGICLPNTMPQCGQCPFAEKCLAHKRGEERQYPVMPEKAGRGKVKMSVFLIHYRDRIALRKRPEKGLLAGLYEFPNTEGWLSVGEADAFAKSLGFEPLRIRKLPDAKHVFTHREWHMQGFDVLVDEAEEIPFSGNTGYGPDGKGQVFMADRRELRDVWSVPSAFAVYRQIAEDAMEETTEETDAPERPKKQAKGAARREGQKA